ncbi:udp-glucose:sterol glycosyltransferase [Diplodia corticola]|uniref:sterol 3beta-glucosyltransferase n=1 Tax=Diplodia corticola TaxID=236234 RepID=A0A1J9S9B8_9PEZI|nr:udp-glucose:sterol glycosyltransferase [Diplodia corticola]OJD37095.1 udp-glucose:sterol glycosyltransferase [Diplodia corticola]
MASEHNSRDQPPRWSPRRSRVPRKSFEIPERLRHGQDEDEDEDVTAPKSNDPRYTHRSVFDLITHAGSVANLRSRFTHDELSEGEEEADHAAVTQSLGPSALAATAPQSSAQPEQKSEKHRRNRSIIRTLQKLHVKPSKDRSHAPADDAMSSSQILTPKPPQMEQNETGNDGTSSVEGQLKAKAEMEASALGSDLRTAHDAFGVRHSAVKGPDDLSQRLMEIFGFDAEEDVVSEHPCWLLQTVLLQGYLYITQKHICFYAYLPKKTKEITKSGYLSKRGRTMWNRSWFILKGDVLAYYNDPTDLYFPRGRINLRYATSAVLMEHKDKAREPTDISISTNQKNYVLRAESAASAKEWVKLLQKVIFKSHNDGDSVKISIPLSNVMEIEDNPVLDYADTIKVGVVDNDDSYAVDEYFFSFFGSGEEPMRFMKNVWDGCRRQPGLTAERPTTPAGEKRLKTPASPPSRNSGSPVRSTIFQPTLGTLSPTSPPFRRPSSRRVSGESARSSSDRGRRSFSRGQEKRLSGVAQSEGSSRVRDSSESACLSMEPDTSSSAAIQSINETDASASQILSRSDVFHRPAVELADSDVNPRASQDTARSAKKHPYPRTEQTISTRSRTPVQNSREMGNDSELQDDRLQASASGYYSGIVSAGAKPFTRATGLVGSLRRGTLALGSRLTTDTMSVYDKVSGMWAGGRKHYGEDGQIFDEEPRDIVDDSDAVSHNERFRQHFALPDSESLRATFFCNLWRVLPQYGKIYMSDRYFCFRSLLPGTRTKLVLPLRDIENVMKEKSFRLTHQALVVVVRGHEELFFDFSRGDIRDDCAVTIHQKLEQVRYLHSSGLLSEENLLQAEEAKAENDLLQHARIPEKQPALPARIDELEQSGAAIIFDDPQASMLDFTPREPMRITCLTIGSRGDVQPYIALCKRLMKEGHQTKIASHEEFGDWVRSHGIGFEPVAGNPAELMQLCVESGMFTATFLAKAHFTFRGWLSALLESAWQACQDSDLLIESPSTMAGIHIAEALEIPYFRAFTMPWTRTRAYPHAFAVQEKKMGGTYNFLSYVLFEEVFWKATSSQINSWRRKTLKLAPTSLKKLQINKIPFMYNFSPSVVAPPLDFSDWVRVTGYWFLDESQNYKPPKDLLDFISRARSDGKKLVYIGFGSIVVEDPRAMEKSIVEAVVKADVRCILSKGWSDRLGKDEKPKVEVPLPAEVHQISSAPHDWLFRQIDAAAHHGGAGTTGASLRAGIPTIIKPFFGDQYFFASRVEDLGVGVHIKKLNVGALSRALWTATHDDRMITGARLVGEKIRNEDGAGEAVKTIYRDLEYARSLIKWRNRPMTEDDLGDDAEEEWTFVDDDNDPELRRHTESDQAVAQMQAQLKQLRQGGHGPEGVST